MATLAQIVVELQANTATLQRGMSDGTAAIRKFAAQTQRDFQNVQRSVDGLLAPLRLMPALIAGVASNSLVQMARRSLDAAGGLGELAEQLGVSTDSLQAYQFAATQSGVSSEELERSLAFLTRRIGEAATGGDEALKAFKSLGVGVLDASGKVRSTETVLRDVAEAIAQTPDPAKRAALAFDAFGRAGQRMLPFLSGGAAGLQRFIDEARATGVVLNRDLIDQADRASDKIAAMEASFSALNRQIAALMAGPAGDFAVWMRQILGGATQMERLAAAQEKVARLSHLAGPHADNTFFPALARARAEVAALQTEAASAARNRDRLADNVPGRTSLPQSQADLAAAAAERKRQVEASFHATMKQAMEEAKRDDEARRASAESIKRQIAVRTEFHASMDRELEQMRALQEAAGVSEAEYERVRAVIDMTNQARARGVSIADEEIAAHVRAVQAQQEAIDIQLKAYEDQRRAAEDAKRAQEAMAEAARDVYHVIGTAAEDAVVRMQSMREVAAGLLQDLTRILLRAAVFKPLEASVMGALPSGGGGLLSGLFGSGGGAVHSGGHAARFAGEFAEGGYIPAGSYGLTGERGPELVMGPATVVPSGEFGAGGDVHVHLTVNAGVSQTVRAEIMNLMPQITASVKSAVADAAQRGGRFGQALRA